MPQPTERSWQPQSDSVTYVLPWRRCSILVHSEDTHGDPPVCSCCPLIPHTVKFTLTERSSPAAPDLLTPPGSSLCREASPSPPRCLCPVS